jgi:AcrR family transcriptional regulator
VLERGLSRLTLDAVVERSGENRALVRYHFGNKAGLITALVDSVFYQTSLALVGEIGSSSDKTRLHVFIEGLQSTVEKEDLNRLIFELFPYILRDENLRRRAASVYEWYRQLNLEWMGLDPTSDGETSMALGALTVAMVDGLFVQLALRPPGFDLAAVFSTLESLLAEAVNRLQSNGLTD